MVFFIVVGICEILNDAAMPRIHGFTQLWPSLFCAFFILVSMYLLSLATRSISIGTAYAAWVGIGAVGTAVYGIIAPSEDKSLPCMLCFALIIAGIAG